MRPEYIDFHCFSDSELHQTADQDRPAVIFFAKKSSKKFEKIWRFGFFAYLCIRVQGKRIKTEQNGAVVQLVRIPACHAGGRGFESRPHRKRTSSFESREHSSVGSERLPYKQRVGGSTPSAPTKETPLQIAVRAFFFSLHYHTRDAHRRAD